MPTCRRLAFLALVFLILSISTPQAVQAESSSSYRFTVGHSEVASLRLEIFDAASRDRVFDSGIVYGESFELHDEDLPEKSSEDRWVFELRTWDAAGELLGSHTSRLQGGSEIFSIGFEQVPAGTRVVSDPIGLEGSVDVAGDLHVAGVTRTAGLTDANSGKFFGSCATNSAIRTIDDDGTVQCEATGDDLGNHRATANIQLQGRFLSGDGGNEGIFVDSDGDVGIGTSDTGNAELRVDGAGGSRLALNTSTGFPDVRITSMDSDPAVLSLVTASGSVGYQLRVTSDDRFHIFTSSPVVSVDPAGRVGIGTENPGFRLHVDGSAGKPGGGSWASASDARLKTVDRDFERGLEALKGLRPIHYRYREGNPLGLGSGEEHVGFRAQDVRRVIPEAVDEGEDGFLYVDNDPILWTMLNAILELEARVETCDP